MPIKTGIMGGSFDPVHKAHIALAKAAFKSLKLDEIFFVPAYQAPLRNSPTTTSAHDRLEMLRLAVENSGLKARIITFEIEQKKICYAIDTVKYLKSEFPERDFVWLIGSDHISKLRNWKDMESLCALVDFACAMRPEERIENRPAAPCGVETHAVFAGAPKCAKIETVQFEPMDVSSTQIREALKNGKMSDVEFALDKDVRNFILSKELYK